MTKVSYRVHSCTAQPFDADVEFGGKTVQAQVTGLVVELVSTDPGGMSHTLKVVPDSPDALASLEEKFAVGAVIVGEFGPPAKK